MKQYHLLNIFQLTFTGLFFISAMAFLTSKLDAAFADSQSGLDWDVATISLIITAIGTFFAIFFRWRADVRSSKLAEEQARQTEARFEMLENEIAEIKTKLS